MYSCGDGLKAEEPRGCFKHVFQISGMNKVCEAKPATQMKKMRTEIYLGWRFDLTHAMFLIIMRDQSGKISYKLNGCHRPQKRSCKRSCEPLAYGQFLKLSHWVTRAKQGMEREDKDLCIEFQLVETEFSKLQRRIHRDTEL